jgi:hypothetical protein
MGTPFRPFRATRVAPATELSTAALNLAAASRVPVSDVVVDLGSAASRATIVRGGREVETPVINAERAASVLEAFVPRERNTEPRSVQQSIAPGTLVTRGTALDVEFLTPDQVVIGMFEGVHADLAARNVTSLSALLRDSEVTTVLAKPTADLTDADKQNLTAKLQTVNVAVDDTVSTRSLGAAIAGLKAAQAFG